MATNPYFNNINRESEQDLHNSLVVESIQIHGVDVLYIPLDDFDIDAVLQEPKNIKYQKTHVIEAYLPENGETDGQQNIMSRLGFRINKTLDVLIAKSRFHEEVSGRIRPLEGDLIYIGDWNNPRGSFLNGLFEVNQVTYHTPEWPFGDHYVYKLFCETYTYSYEKFETGVPALDQFDLTGSDHTPDRLKLIDEKSSIPAIKKSKSTIQKFDKKNPLTGL